MITRDVNQIYVVPGFVNNARFTGCTLAGYTCTESGATSAIGSSEFYPGFTIDRLGLPRNYNAMMVAPVLFGDYQTSVATGNIAAIKTQTAYAAQYEFNSLVKLDFIVLKLLIGQ